MPPKEPVGRSVRGSQAWSVGVPAVSAFEPAAGTGAAAAALSRLSGVRVDLTCWVAAPAAAAAGCPRSCSPSETVAGEPPVFLTVTETVRLSPQATSADTAETP